MYCPSPRPTARPLQSKAEWLSEYRTRYCQAPSKIGDRPEDEDSCPLQANRFRDPPKGHHAN
ncbi:hypothetical protein [Falsihalocynthiibacter arcticus]|uniref:hypothetical protein n=1 Tax=Falsihalocynthiibacter arcticus TaxID=1579316 RepID=UPI003AAF6A5B